MNIINKFINFLKESKIELKKVNWPNKQQTTQYTILVITISLAIAILLGLFDILFLKLLGIFFK